MSKKVYLIDANSLITPFNLYYSFEFGSRFWDAIKERINNGQIVVLDMVKEECMKKKDALAEWIGQIDDVLDHKTVEYVAGYAEVMQYIQDNPCYSDKALSAWSQDTVADPWLIAVAKARGYTIVTLEGKHSSLSEHRPTSKIKIPDVATDFDVETMHLFEMMRELGLKLA